MLDSQVLDSQVVLGVADVHVDAEVLQKYTYMQPPYEAYLAKSRIGDFRSGLTTPLSTVKQKINASFLTFTMTVVPS